MKRTLEDKLHILVLADSPDRLGTLWDACTGWCSKTWIKQLMREGLLREVKKGVYGNPVFQSSSGFPVHEITDAGLALLKKHGRDYRSRLLAERRAIDRKLRELQKGKRAA